MKTTQNATIALIGGLTAFTASLGYLVVDGIVSRVKRKRKKAETEARTKEFVAHQEKVMLKYDAYRDMCKSYYEDQIQSVEQIYDVIAATKYTKSADCNLLKKYLLSSYPRDKIGFLELPETVHDGKFYVKLEFDFDVDGEFTKYKKYLDDRLTDYKKDVELIKNERKCEILLGTLTEADKMQKEADKKYHELKLKDKDIELAEKKASIEKDTAVQLAEIQADIKKANRDMVKEMAECYLLSKKL